MLAPKRGLRVAPVPPKTADLTRPVRGSRNNGRSGRRNRRFDRTKEQSKPHGPSRPGIAIAARITDHSQLATQWWVRLNTPHTQKFGHSQSFQQLDFIVFVYPRQITVP